MPAAINVPAGTVPSAGEAGSALGFIDYGDQAIAIFDKIFGVGWQDFATGGGANIDPSIIMSIFGMLNSVVMMGTSIIIVYMLAIGAMGTANEGTPLGKQYSTLYTPLRMAFSVSLLAPIPGAGISMLQAMLLAMTYFGFGAANQITMTATEYINENHGSVYAIKSPENYGGEIKRAILESFMIQRYQTEDLGKAIASTDGSAVSVNYVNENGDAQSDGAGEWVFRFNKSDDPKFAAITSDQLGVIKLGCTSMASASCTARKDGVVNAISTLQRVATELYNENKFDYAAYNAADSSLRLATRQLRKDFNDRESPEHKQTIKLITDEIDHGGWITLGQFYWVIAQLSEEAAAEFKLDVTVIRPDFGGLSEAVRDAQLEGKYARIDVHLEDHAVSAAVEAEKAGHNMMFTEFDEQGNGVGIPEKLTATQVAHLADSSDGGVIDLIFNQFGRATAFMILDAVVGNEHDPVTSLANVGHVMIGVGETMAIFGVGVDVFGNGAAEAADNVSGGFWGTVGSFATGGISDAGAGFIKGFLIALVSKIFLAMSSAGMMLIVSGAGLAFYLPLVPYIMYTLAVIGVFILILESLVAAPLWASAIAMPQGEGLLGDHGKQGFMLFAGVLFRPPLLVTGFFISWLLMSAIGPWVLGGFKVAFTGITNNHSVGIVTIVSIVFITSLVMITVSHKVFGLITWLPNNVMRWMGQQMSDLGEARETEGVGGKFAAIMNTSGAATKGAAPSLKIGGGGESDGKGAKKDHAPGDNQ